MVSLIVWFEGYNQNINCIPPQGHCNNMYNLAYFSAYLGCQWYKCCLPSGSRKLKEKVIQILVVMVDMSVLPLLNGTDSLEKISSIESKPWGL